MAVALVQLDPGEEFAVTLAVRDLGAQRVGVNAEEGEDTLVVWAGVVEGACGAGEFGAAFVEHAGKQGVAAEAGADAAWGTEGKVGDGDAHADILRMSGARGASGSRTGATSPRRHEGRKGTKRGLLWSSSCPLCLRGESASVTGRLHGPHVRLASAHMKPAAEILRTLRSLRWRMALGDFLRSAARAARKSCNWRCARRSRFTTLTP